MKVKVSQLVPNPLIHSGNIPVDRKRVSLLVDSIRQSGVWPGLVGREVDGNRFEIPFGRHRIEAVREALGPDYLVDVEVRDLTDLQMIQMGIQENETCYEHNWRGFVEAIRALQALLTRARDQIDQYLKSSKVGRGVSVRANGIPGRSILARAIGVSESRVGDALAVIGVGDDLEVWGAESLRAAADIARLKSGKRLGRDQTTGHTARVSKKSAKNKSRKNRPEQPMLLNVQEVAGADETGLDLSDRIREFVKCTDSARKWAEAIIEGHLDEVTPDQVHEIRTSMKNLWSDVKPLLAILSSSRLDTDEGDE